MAASCVWRGSATLSQAAGNKSLVSACPPPSSWPLEVPCSCWVIIAFTCAAKAEPKWKPFCKSSWKSSTVSNQRGRADDELSSLPDLHVGPGSDLALELRLRSVMGDRRDSRSPDSSSVSSPPPAQRSPPAGAISCRHDFATPPITSAVNSPISNMGSPFSVISSSLGSPCIPGTPFRGLRANQQPSDQCVFQEFRDKLHSIHVGPARGQ
ncbi:hypothetical protein SKAU_G00409420 [Synaphobranchus kaupii]|uniref:Uncharacterized protein n=1 Tax=Synaphobranchus kaupii TaxID=118154 RepID=A0A9Q1EAM2_SYNKA|nr:hypothetical protein SKAU_G00409420 [Synaphobranchus kaupii]